MDPRSQVLLRQAALFSEPTMLAGLPADELLGELPQACGWSWNHADHLYLDKRFPGRAAVAIDVPEKDFEQAVLFLPKSRELTDYLLQALASRLNGKMLYLVGEKRSGIESIARQLDRLGSPQKLDSARHCQLWRVHIETCPAPPVLQTLARQYRLELTDGALEVISLPGVFSHGRLDRGSHLLLQHLHDLPEGHLLDFGCGSGILGAALKHRYPSSQITLLDSDAFALESSRLTLERNALQADVLAGSGISSAPAELSAIISNPPFHQGVHTHYQATEQLLIQAGRHLRSGGELRIVANSFLKYPPLLEQYLGPSRILAEADGFRIYSACCN